MQEWSFPNSEASDFENQRTGFTRNWFTQTIHCGTAKKFQSFKMVAAHVSARSILSSFLPRLSASTTATTSRFATLYSRQLLHPLLPSLAFALPSAIQLNVPGLLEGIWESILRAVPKKKTSHMKQRSRRMAGKALKDVTALNKCSACGHVKRAHLLCPYCVKGMLS